MRHLLTLACAVLVGQAVAAQYGAPAPTPLDAKPADAYGSEDRAVLTAVIDHSIRPQVQKVTGRSSVVVFVVDHTAPACDRFRQPRSQPFCMFGLAEDQPSDLDGSNSDFLPLFTEVIPSAAHRTELWASITARNTGRQVVPISEGPNLKLLAAPPMVETAAGPASPIYTVFSLPGYSSAGHAVVSGFIDCGEKCGQVLVWVLEKRGADWRVRVRDGLYDYGGAPEFLRAAIYKPPPLE